MVSNLFFMKIQYILKQPLSYNNQFGAIALGLKIIIPKSIFIFSILSERSNDHSPQFYLFLYIRYKIGSFSDREKQVYVGIRTSNLIITRIPLTALRMSPDNLFRNAAIWSEFLVFGHCRNFIYGSINFGNDEFVFQRE